MVAAFTVFLEHPIAGVGPGHFSTYYARKYGNEVGVKYLRSNRRAHNLYIEMIANLGLIGITSFMAIALFMIYRLWQARRRFLATRPELAQLAVALILSICAYLGSAMFLHLSFQRYYWFTLALAGAALQIFAAESRSGLFAASAAEQAPKPRTLESPELKA
jgi:O-antigen ligase